MAVGRNIEVSSIAFSLDTHLGKAELTPILLLTSSSLQGCSYTMCLKEKKNKVFLYLLTHLYFLFLNQYCKQNHQKHHVGSIFSKQQETHVNLFLLVLVPCTDNTLESFQGGIFWGSPISAFQAKQPDCNSRPRADWRGKGFSVLKNNSPLEW